MDIEKVQEFYSDGSLSYECTKRYLSPLEEHLFDRRISLEGRSFIRINQAIKHNIDGSIRWKLIYDDYGEVIKG